MKITVEMQRVGTSRVSPNNIPISARVRQGNQLGEDLLGRMSSPDVDSTKRMVREMLERRVGAAVTIDWIDRTNEK